MLAGTTLLFPSVSEWRLKGLNCRNWPECLYGGGIGLATLHERRHKSGGLGWHEVHRFSMIANQPAGLRVGTQIGFYPDYGVAGFQTAVVWPGKRPVVISENEIDIPAQRWEVRASGLWADHICEEPFVHWSFGLEAFALQVDNPEELLGRAVGERVPLGWELEFESTVGRAKSHSETFYSQRGWLHGELLFAGGPQLIEGKATRSHWWGETMPPHESVPEVGTETYNGGLPVALPAPNHIWCFPKIF